VESVFYQERASELIRNVEAAISLLSSSPLDMSHEWATTFPKSLFKSNGDDVANAIRYAEGKFESDFIRAVSMYSSSFIDRVIGLNSLDGDNKDKLSLIWRKFDVALHLNNDRPEKQFLFCSEVDSAFSLERIKLVANNAGESVLNSIDDDLSSAIKKHFDRVPNAVKEKSAPSHSENATENEDKREFHPIFKVGS
jgi:hypothetical protein